MKPTIPEVATAVRKMGLMIPFFPKDIETQSLIVEQLRLFVDSNDALNWLVQKAGGSMRDWERNGGIPELRGLYCTKYTPIDGMHSHSTTPGYTATDLEGRFLLREIEDAQRRFDEYRRKEIESGEPLERLELPGAKCIPGPKRVN
jgi:hypothetical protein